MSKQKTHKGTAKRVKKTGRGKLMREHAYQNHFLSKKSSSRKRAYNKKHRVDVTMRKNIKKALGDR